MEEYETIIISADKNGNLTIEEKGFIGDSCSELNEQFATLGVVKEKFDTSIPDGRQKLPNMIGS